MKSHPRPLSDVVIRDLMMEALASETFKKYGYRGRQSNLFQVMECIAIDQGLIEKKVEVAITGWGADSRRLYEGSNTNFTAKEIETMFAVFWTLLNQHIIAPGSYGESEALPQFHVTPHGKICIKEKEILPYDIDGYLAKVRAIPDIDEWVEFYIVEAVRCFNANSLHAATVMIGLTAEQLTINLFDAFEIYLTNNLSSIRVNPALKLSNQIDTDFKAALASDWKISSKQNVFKTYYDNITNHPKTIKGIMDSSSRKVFQDYARLTRNEVSHPNELKKDYTETLLLLVSFVKYIELVTQLTSSFKVERI